MNAPPPPTKPSWRTLPTWQWISIACVLLLVLGSAGYLAAGLSRSHIAPAAASLPSGGDFTLGSADGPVPLQRFRGQWVIIYFGYTACPDACPTTLSALTQGLNLLTPEEVARIQPLLVSVDPARDTPSILKEYATFFHPRLLGITGSPAEIAAVARSYGVYYARHEGQSANGYSVDHTSSLYLLDRQGKLIQVLPHGTQPAQIAAALRQAQQH